MKQKTTLVYVMTLVITGLLITSAAGIPAPAIQKTKPATEKKNNINVDPSYVAALFEKNNINPATKKISQAEQKMSVEKTTVKSEVSLMELSEERQMDTSLYESSKSRAPVAPVQSHALHPGMGDDHTGNIALGYEFHYFNDTQVPAETFDGVIYTLSDDFGNNWTDPWTLVRNISGTEQEIPLTYPSIDYMDYNASEGGNVFYGTFNELTETFQSGADDGYRWYNGTNVSFMKVAWGDIDNPDVWVRTWTAFGRTTPPSSGYFKYWYDMSASDIAAADDFYFEVNRSWQPFGLCSFVIDLYSEDPQDPSIVDGCHWFYPIEYNPGTGWENRYGLMWHFIDTNGAQATSTAIDKTPAPSAPEDKKAYAVWDPLGDRPGQHVVLIASINMSLVDGMNDNFHYTAQDTWDGVSWSMLAERYSLEYPDIAVANNGEIIIAQEMINISNPAETMLSLWYCNSSDGNTSNMSISGTWLFDYSAYYPEVSWVGDDTFMVQWQMDNKLYAAFSFDNGRTWCLNQSEGWIEYYQWSGDEYVQMEHRGHRLADEASISIWEYDDSTPPTEYSTKLFYRHNWYILDGYCFDAWGVPVDPVDVRVSNTNETNFFRRTPTITGNYYCMQLLLGFDVWTDPEAAPFRIYARDSATHYKGVTDHDFTEINPVNTINITVDKVPGDVDFDGDVELSDLAKLLGSYGCCTPDPCYDDQNEAFECDIDWNGCVQLSDLAALLGNYGYP